MTNVTVPNVVGQGAYQATEALWQAGLVVTTPAYSYSSVVAPTVVMSQSISAGTSVPIGSNVSLTISIGVAPITLTTVVP